MHLEWLVRKIMQRYWRWQRAVTLGARGIVIDGDSRVLLVRHTYGKGWLFPGGGVEFRETLETAVTRELEEETGIAPTGSMELLGVYSNSAVFPGDHVAVFVVRTWRRTREVKPNHEIAEQGFFPIDALPPGTGEGTRRRLDEMLGRVPRRELW